MIKKFNFNISIYVFFFIYFIVGILIYKDYGLGIEEHFQRQNGFFWLNYFVSDTNFDVFKSLVNLKYEEILQADPYLPDPNFFNFYGIVFDLPLAFIETLFKLDSSKSYFELRHLCTFLIFFISSIFFYKILKNRFNNNSIIFLGLFFYIFSPRIFGDSFHNNKDILFLSILTIAISYLFEVFKKQNNKFIILFCFFSALATSSRIMGIYLPLMLIIFYFFDFLINNFSFKNFIYNSFKVLIIFYIFLILHYPHAWNFNFFEFKNWFNVFFYWMDIEVLFNGNYYMIKYLPRSYLPTWILISTPILITLFFILGIFLTSNDKKQAIDLYVEIIQSKNNFYSILSLNNILEKNLITEKNKILNYFEIIEKIDLSEETKDLVLFKKALYLIKISDTEAGNKILNDLINKNSNIKPLAQNVIGK